MGHFLNDTLEMVSLNLLHKKGYLLTFHRGFAALCGPLEIPDGPPESR